jgi:hypothetical protein
LAVGEGLPPARGNHDHSVWALAPLTCIVLSSRRYAVLVCVAVDMYEAVALQLVCGYDAVSVSECLDYGLRAVSKVELGLEVGYRVSRSKMQELFRLGCLTVQGRQFGLRRRVCVFRSALLFVLCSQAYICRPIVRLCLRRSQSLVGLGVHAASLTAISPFRCLLGMLSQKSLFTPTTELIPICAYNTRSL